MAQAPSGQLKTAAEVLDGYKQALGGPEAIQKVQSETVHGEIEGTGINSKVTFVYYAKPFKNLMKVTMPNGSQIQSGFDGTTSWTIRGNAASIDKDVPLESIRRDADLQYALHQPDYFKSLEPAGVTDFEGHHCYWLHGTTHRGKDNNQFYDVNTGLLAGYRFQADDGSGTVVIACSTTTKISVALWSPPKTPAAPATTSRPSSTNRSATTRSPIRRSTLRLP